MRISITSIGSDVSAKLHPFQGGCHCGAIGFTFMASQSSPCWTIRACQCGFCRAHGARTTSDPDGSVAFHVSDAAQLGRYVFATKAAEFLVCRGCGVYVAAVQTTPLGQSATINVNALQPMPDVTTAIRVSYEAESTDDRRQRRERIWTPVTSFTRRQERP